MTNSPGRTTYGEAGGGDCAAAISASAKCRVQTAKIRSILAVDREKSIATFPRKSRTQSGNVAAPNLAFVQHARYCLFGVSLILVSDITLGHGQFTELIC